MGGTQLLITVDCGITNGPEVAHAKAQGLPSLIIDHHQVPSPLPEAIACLDPHQPGCEFPEKNLCAAGVAFMFLAALRQERGLDGTFQGPEEPGVCALLDWVALATVADLVP